MREKGREEDKGRRRERERERITCPSSRPKEGEGTAKMRFER